MKPLTSASLSTSLIDSKVSGIFRATRCFFALLSVIEVESLNARLMIKLITATFIYDASVSFKS